MLTHLPPFLKWDGMIIYDAKESMSNYFPDYAEARMQTPPVFTGYRAVVIEYEYEGSTLDSMRGWGCGYVGVPYHHPWWGKNTDDINGANVHDGITWSENHLPNAQPEPPNYKGLWWVGFDTGHANDNKDIWPQQAVIDETKKLLQQAKDADKTINPEWLKLAQAEHGTT